MGQGGYGSHDRSHGRFGIFVQYVARRLLHSTGHGVLGSRRTCGMERPQKRIVPVRDQVSTCLGCGGSPNTLVADCAVATFVPAYDPSNNEEGAKTNLMSCSVTIAVSDFPGVYGQKTERGAPTNLPNAVCIPNPQRIDFLQTFSSEGALGNRYEKSTLTTSFAGRRYEISLFVHSSNPGCYPVGVPSRSSTL